MRWLSLALVAAFGCQSSDEPSCKVMADHVGTLLGSDAEATELRATFETRCVEDRWSQGMRKCIASTTSMSAPQNCRIYLNDSQQQRWEQVLAASVAKDLPQICAIYETMVRRAQQCEALPRETRTDLATKLADHQREWTKDLSTAENICGAGVQALRAAAPDCFK